MPPPSPQPILHEQFSAGTLPARWYTDTPFPKYSPGAWDCTQGDGVIIPLPHDAWESLRVEVELTNIDGPGSAFCGTDARTGLTIALGSALDAPPAKHSATDGGLIITQSQTPPPIDHGNTTLTYEWTRETMRASAGELELIATPNLRQSARAGTLQTGFRGCIVKRITVTGVPMPAAPPENPRAIAPGFPLEVTVDFNDDLMAAAWTRKTFDALFTELKSWGTRTVSWIDLGREADAYFDFAPFGTGEHGRETFKNVGDLFTAAVEAAHAKGIELIGILKPYDMAIMGITWPPESEMAKKHGRIHRIGGSLGWSTRMAEENQHLIMARKPSAFGPAKNAAWTRIDLVKDNDAPAAISFEDISIIVSDDNEHFRPYLGAMRCAEVVEEVPVYRCTPSGARPGETLRRSRVLRFSGLQIREAFVALEVRGGKRSFANRLCDLVHVYGEKGEETHITYGLTPRKAPHQELYDATPASVDPTQKPAGPQNGFEFNRYPGTPTAAHTSGGDGVNTPIALDRGAVSYIALARGKDRGPGAAFSPSFPQTRALWMTWVTAMLDAGADGIDIRPGNHHSDFAWCEYGFEKPVRDEMLTRTGVDIWLTDDFDMALWRKIRGEGWTQFIREASALVRARGKKLTLHIDGHYDNAPGLGGAMNMEVDWRLWLREGLCDRVTGKALWPESSLAREVLAEAHAAGVPVSYAPYCNNFFEDRRSINHVGASPVGCEVPVDRLIKWGKEAGYDSFVFYECASALWAGKDETVFFRPNAAPLRDVMQRYFSRDLRSI